MCHVCSCEACDSLLPPSMNNEASATQETKVHLSSTNVLCSVICAMKQDLEEHLVSGIRRPTVLPVGKIIPFGRSQQHTSVKQEAVL